MCCFIARRVMTRPLTAALTNLIAPYRSPRYFHVLTIVEKAFAKRLASEHMYQHGQEWSERHAKGKKKYISLFPATYDRKTLDNLDDHGVVKPGTTVKFGDPLILAAEERERTHSKVHRGRAPALHRRG